MALGNDNVTSESIGERIARLRTEKGATQQEMAAALYVDRVTVSQWETGQRDIKTGNMVALALYLDVSCDHLLGRTRTAAPDDFIQEVVSRYGLTEHALKELGATVKLASYLEQEKVIDNNHSQFLDALNTLICHHFQFPIVNSIWKFLFAPIAGVTITEPPLTVPPEWTGSSVNNNSNGGARALNETEVVNYRLLQLNAWLLKLRDALLTAS